MFPTSPFSGSPVEIAALVVAPTVAFTLFWKNKKKNSSVSTSCPKTLKNKKVVLKQRPDGPFHAARDTKLVEEIMDVSSIAENDILVQVHALSIDAFIRTTLDEQSYHLNSGLDQPINALGYGKVIKGNKQFPEGTMVQGFLSASEYTVVSSDALATMTKKMDLPKMPPHLSLGLLGISGLAAYIGMFVSPMKPPKKGDTVVVSAAAGAVGCIAAQMAKSCGARVIGIAGGAK